MMTSAWRAGLSSAGLAGALLAGSAVPASAQPTAGAEDFTVIVAGNGPQLFIARGSVDAVGSAVEVTSFGGGGGVDEMKVPGGTFTLTLLNNPDSGGGSQNPVTCIDTFFGTGTSTISAGTGTFAGVTGTGTYTFDGAFVEQRTAGGCSQQGTVFDTVLDHGSLTQS